MAFSHGKEDAPPISSPVGTTEIINNFELRILNLAGLCKLAQFVGVKQGHFWIGPPGARNKISEFKKLSAGRERGHGVAERY